MDQRRVLNTLRAWQATGDTRILATLFKPRRRPLTDRLLSWLENAQAKHEATRNP